MTDYGYHPTHRNLNEGMSDRMEADFRRFQLIHQGNVEVEYDNQGEIAGLIFPDAPTSVQSVQEAVMREQERNENLGN